MDKDNQYLYMDSVLVQSRKFSDRRKDLADISYASQVVAHFVPNFVAMATRVGWG